MRVEPITLALIGAGNRGGDAYGGWVLRHPDQARVVAVADPNPERRCRAAEKHGVEAHRVFASWEELLAGGRPADAVVVATPDHMHIEPTLRALELGCDVLLEKPIAPDREQTEAIARALGWSGDLPGTPAPGSGTGFPGGGSRSPGDGLQTPDRGSRSPGGTGSPGSGSRSFDRGSRSPGGDSRSPGGGSRPTVTVAHVLRYTPFFTTLKRLLDEGRIGRLMTMQYTENIGYWHFAHSYVRGNWRRLDQSSPMILAKACHDLDMMRWLAGAPCRRVASFGELSWFRRENKPEGAPLRCIDGCPVGDECAFNAVTFYVEGLAEHHGWPVSVISTDTSREGRIRALQEGPYGRCVYQSDNDVVDHQVTALEFANGVTATFNVTGFTEENTRTLKLMGSGGEIRGHLDKGELEIRTFGRPELRDGVLRSGAEYEVVRTAAGSGHAGGDAGLMAAFVERIRRRKRGEDPGEMRTSLFEALESHFMAFAAEQSRAAGAVVSLDA